ncbi:MAG TPA: metallophosphoesterase [Polyangiaceae bacterium]|jgi:3',5'-cyclic AMP phosphodiesterase CpdA|nr:metallophosphoesterase [Polyangiaceae bacterium]
MFTLAHVSDLHVSAFGDTLHDRKHLVRRSARVADTSESRFATCWEEESWRVLRDRQKRKDVFLVDPDGYSHPIPSVRESGGLLDPVERAAAKACRLEARRACTLASAPPTEGALASMIETTPHNANLRALRAARVVAEHAVDAVVMTGDCTDDGEGWELIEGAFRPWYAKGMLLVIPGNHDLYRFPIASSARPRPTAASKLARWQVFAAGAGMHLEPCGAWKRAFPEAGVVIAGLNSCARRQRAFFRQNGAIGPAQLDWLRALSATPAWRDARHRLVLFHHHVVPLPHGVGKRAPTEIGMRLDDRREFAETLAEVGATLVMHGHRHISERRSPAGHDFELLAAPSLTLGCKSGDAPSFWKVELDARVHIDRVRIPFEAVEQENDPGTDPPPPPESGDLDPGDLERSLED